MSDVFKLYRSASWPHHEIVQMIPRSIGSALICGRFEFSIDMLPCKAPFLVLSNLRLVVDVVRARACGLFGWKWNCYLKLPTLNEWTICNRTCKGIHYPCDPTIVEKSKQGRSDLDSLEVLLNLLLGTSCSGKTMVMVRTEEVTLFYSFLIWEFLSRAFLILISFF